MGINFIIYKEVDTEELIIYDYSDNTTYTSNINNWVLEVSSTKLSSIVSLDIIDYLYNNRVVNELYIIKPETLGFTDTFTDGLYKLEMKANNDSLSKTHYIILYSNIYTKFKELLVKYNYKFEVSPVGYINWINDSGDCYTEEIRILSGLIDELVNYQFIQYSTTVENEINDIIEKANRIAEIINN